MSRPAYQIAIPSYHRPTTLRDKTLAYLRRTDVDVSRVTVFVADQEQRKAYAAVLPGVKLVVAVPGMRAVRNFIQTYYKEGTLVLNLDDDIETIIRRDSDKVAVEETSLDAVICKGFEEARRRGARLWGIYPVKNPFFMKDRVSAGLFYIEGAVWGFTTSHSPAYSVTLDDKEDFERSLLCFQNDGVVVRLDRWAMVSKFYKEPGGMQHDGKRTRERILSSAEALVKRFPGLCKLNMTKKSGFPEVRLINPQML